MVFFMNAAPLYTPHPDKVSPDGCISIIGMAAAGKTTIGRELAALIGWAHLDSDHAIEATYGAALQTIAVSMSKEAFLALEGDVISRLHVKRCVLSTGGSAVYHAGAVACLKRLGPVIYIAVSLPVILERIARKPERGLAIDPGQTIEDLYLERIQLYEAAADYTVEGGHASAVGYAGIVARWLSQRE
jgi:shikimate kinase